MSLSRLKAVLVDAIYHFRLLFRRRSWRTIIIFYLFAEQDRYPEAWPSLLKIIDRIKGYKKIIVKIDNFNQQKQWTCIAPNIFEVGGDNSQWEFSGWKKAVRLAHEAHLAADVALFVNDSFLNSIRMGFNFQWFKNSFNSFTLDKITESNAIGKVFATESRHVICDNHIDIFLQSHFFATSFDLARHLRFSYFDDSEIEKWFASPSSGRLFSENAPLSQEFQSYVMMHLSEKWRPGVTFSKDNYNLFKGKALAIINERMLCFDMLRNGGRIIDISTGHVSAQ